MDIKPIEKCFTIYSITQFSKGLPAPIQRSAESREIPAKCRSIKYTRGRSARSKSPVGTEGLFSTSNTSYQPSNTSIGKLRSRTHEHYWIQQPIQLSAVRIHIISPNKADQHCCLFQYQKHGKARPEHHSR